MENSLFDRIGGDAALEAAVDLFYAKVLADPRIASFFDGVDMQDQRSKQRNFLKYAFGGIPNYTGKGMRRAHEPLVEKGLDDTHFDAVLENLGGTLTELGVPTDLVGEAAAIAESVREDVLGRTPVQS